MQLEHNKARTLPEVHRRQLGNKGEERDKCLALKSRWHLSRSLTMDRRGEAVDYEV